MQGQRPAEDRLRPAAVAATVLIARPGRRPLVFLVRGAFTDGVDGVGSALGATRWVAAGHTVVLALVVTVRALLVGTGLAIAFDRSMVRRPAIWRIALVVPLFVPQFAMTISWSQAYGGGGLADHLAGLTLPGLYGPVGIALLLTVEAIPLVWLVVAAGLAVRLEPDLVRAARASGAGTWRTFVTIDLPLLRGPLLAAGAIVVVSVVNSFAVPQVLGSAEGYQTLATLAYQQLSLSAAPNAFTGLCSIALLMVLLVLVAVGGADRGLGRIGTGFARGGEGGAPVVVHRRSIGTRLVAAVIAVYLVLTTAFPMVALVTMSLTKAPGLAPVSPNLTTSNYPSALAGAAAQALGLTLALAIGRRRVVVIIASVVVAAGGDSRRRLGTALTLGYAVPGTALAIGVLVTYGSWLRGSAALILVAYLGKCAALGYRALASGADRIAPELDHAARASGARPGTVFRTITAPIMANGYLAAAGLVVLFGLHELTMSSILYGPTTQTFAVVVLNDLQLGDVGASSALAVILTVPPLLAVCVGAVLLPHGVDGHIVDRSGTRPPSGRWSPRDRRAEPAGRVRQLRTGAGVVLGRPRGGSGGGPRAARSVRLRQDHAAAHGRRVHRTPHRDRRHRWTVVVRPGRWVAPEDRRVGLVFQGAALWPHLDVLDTVAYPIRRGGAPKERARREAYTLLERLSLAALAHRLPSQLSGGEQQRVGLARALARDPDLFLFDEPTAHLDTHLRSIVLEEVARRRQALGAAALYATHNAAEALAIADRVAVLRAGRPIQLDTPQRVYDRPADMETARLTGPASFVAPTGCPSIWAMEGVGQALVRPDWVRLDGDVPGRVESVRYRGPHTDLVVVVGGGRLLVSCPGPPRRQPGDDVGIGLTQAWRMPGDGDRDAVGAARRGHA